MHVRRLTITNFRGVAKGTVDFTGHMGQTRPYGQTIEKSASPPKADLAG
jgi:hypothetical protein